jgi:hypothetical protein
MGMMEMQWLVMEMMHNPPWILMAVKMRAILQVLNPDPFWR